MATPKIIGSKGKVFQKSTVKYDAAKGFTVTEEWASAGDNLAGVASESRAAGMDYTHEIGLIKSRLVRTTTGAVPGIPEQATYVWQLYTNEIQKDILGCAAAVALGPDETAQMIIDLAEIKNGGRDAYEAILSDAFYVANPDAAKLIDLMLHGITSFNISTYSARATISLPYLYTGALPGVATDSLMATLINAIPVGGPNDGTLFNWGWRRMGTSRTFSGDNRTEVNIEWQLNSWAFIYTDVTALPV